MGIIPARAGFTAPRSSAAPPLWDHPRSRGVYAGLPAARGRYSGSSPLARGLPCGARRATVRAGIIPARAGFTKGTNHEPPPRPDHPRSRGVYRARPGNRTPGPGSSPLARGLHHPRPAITLRPRIIPARAGFTMGRAGLPAARGDHPRSRGVYAGLPAARGRYSGSSPLARGLPCGARRATVRAGIIPARAGFTKGTNHEPPPRPDHPRSRGVYGRTWRDGAGSTGSSPLARGLRRHWYHPGTGRRIIPARAGFTPAPRRLSRGSRDHPRSRGVYNIFYRGVLTAEGSSPLARGLHRDVREAERAPRIIPARAGFTEPRSLEVRRLGDHPRSRGVYFDWWVGCGAPAGSSPLARGLLRDTAPIAAAIGIIPARAGFTAPSPSSLSGPRDHPRSRGVYSVSTVGKSPERGSSPLARGLQHHDCHRRHPGRIIPARAGFTSSGRGWWSWRPDHPRSRGVYSTPRTASHRSSGSSPLARGLLNPAQHRAIARRIIPARAGFTPAPDRPSHVRQDHPRSRGVYWGHDVDDWDHAGIIPARAGFTAGAADPAGAAADHPRSRGVYVGQIGPVVVHLRIIPARAGFTCSEPSRARPGADHPRSRGVYCGTSTGSMGGRGSSPLARGLRLAEYEPIHADGIIPARAGFTFLLRRYPANLADHPRSRGVYRRSARCWLNWPGSSPLARGLRRRGGRGCARGRIIPARAGFTRRDPPPARRPGDHPRSRGVYSVKNLAMRVVRGSSPLARGLRPRRRPRRRDRGIIPARAGFTSTTSPTRTCASGSSPLARGLRPLPRRRPVGRRIIPARAGFTGRMLADELARRDHPRSRGVYPRRSAPCGRRAGSSPLARGLPRVPQSALVSLGIIPARAGFTRPTSAHRAPQADHPRSRGVYKRPILIPVHTAGSSPLARGLPGRRA